MSIEGILHTFNSPPSKMSRVTCSWPTKYGFSRTICDWLRERGHFESYKGCPSLLLTSLISVEAQQILTHPKNLKTLETYLAF